MKQFGAVKLLCVAALAPLSSDGPTMLRCGSLSGSIRTTNSKHFTPRTPTGILEQLLRNPKIESVHFCSGFHFTFNNVSLLMTSLLVLPFSKLDLNDH